jgi:uncharacterized protein (DUF885 family)
MRMRVLALCGALMLMISSCSSSTEQTAASSTTAAPMAIPSDATGEDVTTTTAPVSELRRIVDEITTSMLVLQPELVTDLGAGEVIGFDANSRLDDLSTRGRQSLADTAAEGLAALATLEGSDLSRADELSVEILRWYLEDQVTMARFAQYENPVNYITGAPANFAEFMADVHPIQSEQDAEDYVERLIAFPKQVQDLIDRIGEAEESGIVPAATSLSIARWQIQNAMGAGDGASNLLVTDFQDRVEALPDENPAWAAGIGARAAAVVEDLIVPALDDLDNAVRRLDGRSNAESGMTYVPGGDEYYAAVLRHFLTIDMTPEEVHQVGLGQVDRIVAELTTELDMAGYDASGNFALAMRQVAADAGSMPTTTGTERDLVLQRTITTLEKAADVFDEEFTVRPVTELDVVRPRPGREGGSGAYYRSPPIDGSRNGIYYLSLGGPEFPILTMDTTSYHEGIPGHHFQLGVQRSLDALPLHQRVFDFTGYAEGWGLYAERLAYEAGLYDGDPLGNIGRLRMELLRAVRMVADTGIHWDGWSRNEAVDYMLDLGFDRGMAESEVDRYIVWPGQAPAYMVGMLEILRLRDRAAAELGDSFDVVGFHDALLSQGSVPVGLLEDVVDQWIDSVR